MAATKNRYTRLVEAIFERYYQPGAREVPFAREDIVTVARKLRIQLPKNLGDVLYSFRYRAALPASIVAQAPAGFQWIIRPAGQARYVFVLVASASIIPSNVLVETKIPDATPGVIRLYALGDEQALLARLRYNRMVDIFTGLTCYSLQNHLRTTAPGVGQAEIDEVYLGLDRRGAHYVLPVQAKGGRDKIGIVQIEQDFAVCAAKFPSLICRSIAAQFMADDVIALFEFEQTDQGIRVSAEKHYRLARPDELSPEELLSYQARP